jgi:hypothetical protein
VATGPVSGTGSLGSLGSLGSPGEQGEHGEQGEQGPAGPRATAGRTEHRPAVDVSVPAPYPFAARLAPELVGSWMSVDGAGRRDRPDTAARPIASSGADLAGLAQALHRAADLRGLAR